MYDYLYDYGKPKYADNAKLCRTNTDSFIVLVDQKIFIQTFQEMLRQDCNCCSLQIWQDTSSVQDKNVIKSAMTSSLQ